MRRVASLPLAPGGRRVAVAGLYPDRQRHLGDRRFEVARDVDRQRLERRDIERVQPALAAKVAAGGDELAGLRLPRGTSAWAANGFVELHQARQEARQRLAGAGRRDQQHRAAGTRLGEQLELVLAWRPAAARKPAGKRFRQRSSGVERQLHIHDRRTIKPYSGFRSFGIGNHYSFFALTRFLRRTGSHFAGKRFYFVACAFSTKPPVWVLERSTVAPATAGSNTRSTWWAVSTAPGTKRPSGEYIALLAAIARK